MKQNNSLDETHTYFTLKTYFEFTTEVFKREFEASELKVKYDGKQKEAWLESYVNEIILNIDDLPSEWQTIYNKHKQADYKMLAEVLLEKCNPYVQA